MFTPELIGSFKDTQHLVKLYKLAWEEEEKISPPFLTPFADVDKLDNK